MEASVARKAGRPVNPELIARRREEILSAAALIFARRAYAQTDLQEVADELQLGKGTLYRYFPTKQALFLAAVDHGMRRLLAHLAAAADRFNDPLERIGATVHAYLDYFDRHPELAELIIQERAQFRDRDRPSYFLHRDEVLGRYHEAFRRLLQREIVRELEVSAMFDGLGNLLYGTMFTNFFNGRNKSCEEQAREILDIFLNGVLRERRPHEAPGIPLAVVAVAPDSQSE